MVSKNILGQLVEEKLLRSKEKREEKGKENIVTTHHTITIGGKPFRFIARVGHLPLMGEDGKVKGKIFFISYEKDEKEKKKRPITFAFNGGPGAASAWVHFGAMGPKRIKLTQEGIVLPPPYDLEDNEETWLTFTDLVFFDPVGTGYSIPEEGEKKEQFLGVREDAQWCGEFIRAYISKYKRWLSPKFIAGESYGTFRAAGIVHHLQKNLAIDFNGIIMISSAVNYQTFDFSRGNILPYVLALPTYTSVAHYHKKLSEDLQSRDVADLVKEVEKWAYEKYFPALLYGDSLPEERKDQIAKTLSKYTSLSTDYIRKCRLKITPKRFRKKILEKEGLVIGSYDARLKTFDTDPASEEIKADPSMFNIYGSCIATLIDYMERDLKYHQDVPYRPLSKEVGEKWNWSSGLKDRMGYVDLTGVLQEILSYNPYFGIFFACGYYDLCTPYMTTVYTVDHLEIPHHIRKNVFINMYLGGHMMYVYLPARKKMYAEVGQFIRTYSSQKVKNIA